MNEKEVTLFDSWVKIVNPEYKSIKDGIISILKNNTYKDYLNLVYGFRERFSWENQLENFNKEINHLSH